MAGDGSADTARPGSSVSLQSRGRDRVGRILDAAAAIVAEQGIDTLTMQQVAKRSRTSTGSMYHFFADRADLLDALERRHRDAIDAFAATIDGFDDRIWREMPTDRVMPTLIGPFLAYLHAHRDALEFVDIGRWPETDRAFRSVVERVLTVRLGNAVDQVDVVALTIHAVMAGTFRIVSRLTPALSETCISHIPDVLTAYLIRLEGG